MTTLSASSSLNGADSIDENSAVHIVDNPSVAHPTLQQHPTGPSLTVKPCLYTTQIVRGYVNTPALSLILYDIPFFINVMITFFGIFKTDCLGLLLASFSIPLLAPINDIQVGYTSHPRQFVSSHKCLVLKRSLFCG